VSVIVKLGKGSSSSSRRRRSREGE